MNQRVNNITYSIVPDGTRFKEMNYTVETKMGMRLWIRYLKKS